MYSYVWPVTLPQQPMTDFSEDVGVLILRTPTDAGPAKMRRRGKRPSVMNLNFYMSSAQVDTLDTFINSTIKGTARFGFPHPRTQEVVEARFVPQDDGQFYSLSYIVNDRWKVSMKLEVLP